MDASWKNSFEEELLCPICLNVFDEPVQLQCKHNFCKSCITEAWARDAAAAVRCPECNHGYEPKPALEKNYKLANIVRRFNALNTDKAPAALHCALCRPRPPLPVRKVCLRCKEPCCQKHVQKHLQQPCAAPGHLLVDAEELSAWTCPSHDEYRLFHCQDEQLALCPFCCVSHCSKRRHTVCDVDTQRTQMQALLMRQQDRLEGRVQNIDEQVTKLESDKTMMMDTVADLKERVRDQYHRMHMLLENNLSETLQMLETTYSTYARKNSRQVLQLNERRLESKKLLSSVKTFFQRADNINVMKNTKPYEMLMERSNSHLVTPVPPVTVDPFNTSHFIADLSARERNLRKMLEEPLSKVPVVEVVQSGSSHVGTSSGHHKRKCSFGLPDSGSENAASQEPQFLYSAKKPYLGEHRHHNSSMYSSEGLGQNPHAAPCHSRFLDSPARHMVGLGSGSGHHSAGIFPPFPSAGAPQQAMYEGGKVLMCALNDYCGGPSGPSGAQPLFPAPDSFPSMTAQEYPPHGPPPAAQPLQHSSMRGLMEASQAARHPDFFALFGHVRNNPQSSTKHYGTK